MYTSFGYIRERVYTLFGYMPVHMDESNLKNLEVFLFAEEQAENLYI